MVQRGDYDNREQAFVKHFVLQHYLRQLALKIGNFQPGTTLNYIDGFSGPWRHASDELRDTSPYVALTELCAARDTLHRLHRPVDLQIRGMFVEQRKDAFLRLKRLLHEQFSSVQCATHHGEFATFLPQACRFAVGGARPFAFVFIDPTGWTGYGLDAISPLLRVRPCEVMINFMTKDIARFIDDEGSSALQSFIDLFGDPTYREAWRGLKDLDREDQIVETYCRRVRLAGGFDHCAATVILHPRHDRTHYHLVYATRSLHGLVAFRDTERRATAEQHEARAAAKQRKRVDATLQVELLAAAAMETANLPELQSRYRQRARLTAVDLLRSRELVEFDALVAATLHHPMTCLVDLKGWLAAWRDAGAVQFLGLADGERALAVGRRHQVRWRGGLLFEPA